MNPYKVIATSDLVGIIELVSDSITLSDIHNRYTGIFVIDRLKKYLEEVNKDIPWEIV